MEYGISPSGAGTGSAGFACGDDAAVQSATPHLFLLLCQLLKENVVGALGVFYPSGASVGSGAVFPAVASWLSIAVVPSQTRRHPVISVGKI